MTNAATGKSWEEGGEPFQEITDFLADPPWKWDEAKQERYDSIQRHCSEAIDIQAGLEEEWVKVAYKKPPEDLWGRIWWYGRVLTQMILATFTLPAALGGFLLEEGVQSMGMGGYLLSTADRWEELIDYTDHMETFIDTAEMAAKNLAYMAPITGGAVLMYMEAARKQTMAFKRSAWYNWMKQLETDDIQRLKELNKQTYGSIRMSSSPSQAEIWLDNINTEQLTPQTYKDMNPGDYEIQLRHYSKQRETWDVWAGTISITAGKHKEIMLHIPETIKGEEEPTPGATTGTLRLLSAPSNAQIWLNGTDTGMLTPETFKNMEPGTYHIELRAFSRKLKIWDSYAFDVEIKLDEKLEMKVNIPGEAYDAIRTPDEIDEEDTPKLPDFIKAEVTGDRAKDGDTFVTISDETVRLIGIDTPELGRPYASLAAKFLQDNIEDKELTIKIQTHRPFDIYGRTLAEVRNYKGNINVALLAAGLARQDWFEEDIFDRTRYQAAEDLARARGVGIWGGIIPKEEIPPEEPTVPITPGVEIEERIEPVMLDAYVEGAEAITGDVFSTDEGEIVHILGILAPPESYELFEESRINLDSYIKNKRVHLYIQSNRLLDEVGNTYAIAKAGALNMAIEQLRDGLAVQQTATTDIYDTREYIEHERLARAREIGIWK